MSSDEMEKFSVTEDDLLDELNPNRRHRRMTKNKATYGIWADADSDDERPSFGGGRSKKDYTVPMNFVSGGVKVGDKIHEAGDKEDDEGGDEADSESDSEFDKGIYAAAQKKSQGSTFQQSAYRYKKKEDQQFGDWEKHTRGIGQKLLEKYGFVHGKGLGPAGKGISTPVEAMVRKGRGTLGFYGTERTERSLKDFPLGDDREEGEEQEGEQPAVHKSQWRKSGKKSKPKYVFKTADEIIATGIGKRTSGVEVKSELAKVKVIDMTGKEQRVMSGYQSLSNKHDRPEEDDVAYSKTDERKAFDVPELLHNLDLLVDTAEQEIIKNDRKIKHEKDLSINLKHEKDKVDAICKQEEEQINKLKYILDIIEICEERTKPGCDDPLTLAACEKILKQLQEEFYEEYRIFELWALAEALVFPLIKKELSGWDPLVRPRHGIPMMKQWRALLADIQQQGGGEASVDAYQRLIWEVWIPHVRTCVGKWSVRNCDPMIEMLEAWMPLLPEWVFTNILDQLIMPRLQKEVDEWNPLTDTMPIHAWLHPWLPLMGERLEPLFAPIRHKLANALGNWHPSDPSAKMILDPWVPVFAKAQMNSFVVKNILPKLAMCMQEFVVNPNQQQLDAWHWVMRWLDLVPTPNMATLLEHHFFPKWLQVLTTWLSNNPNYDEVTKWYSGWKAMINEKLLIEPAVKNQFNKALDIMNRSVQGNFQPGARESVAYLAHTERRGYDSPPPPLPPPPIPPVDRRDYDPLRTAPMAEPVPSTFKELLERRAQENNILFLPIVNKTYEAKQVYRFGNVQIYLDRGVIFVMEGSLWIPISLQQLLNRAK